MYTRARTHRVPRAYRALNISTNVTYSTLLVPIRYDDEDVMQCNEMQCRNLEKLGIKYVDRDAFGGLKNLEIL